MKKHIAIAIDGPAAAGKSTIAKLVAKKLGFTYIDTGAMYRAFTWAVLEKGLNPQNAEESCSIIDSTTIRLTNNNDVFVNDVDVTKKIREPFVSGNVSYIASYKPIRLALVEQQRAMAKYQSVVMDGRDIGTYVLPNAQLKVFQVASVETRALRRYKENAEKGIDTSLTSIAEELAKRDYIDSHRDFAPLRQASDAILLDTNEMTIEEVVEAVLKLVHEKVGL
ncbi:MAG TPA: (d)CMP kinase [Bacilli bacterium]|nr:(d)CMP kinase [Bacilli bacterium]